MPENDRRAAILGLLREHQRVETDALARRFRVTVQTIRRDLDRLEGDGLLTRTHGGAVPRSSVANIGYADRQTLNLDAKRAIARTAARLIPDRASLYLDIGTTAEALAAALLNHDGLMVITNNLRAATILAANPTFEVIVAGGVLRQADAGLVGEQTVGFLRQFRPDFACLSASALDLTGDFLDYDFREVQVSRIARTQAHRAMLLADASKFRRRAPVRIGSLEDLEDFVTDASPPGDLAGRLAAWDTALHVAANSPL